MSPLACAASLALVACTADTRPPGEERAQATSALLVDNAWPGFGPGGDAYIGYFSGYETHTGRIDGWICPKTGYPNDARKPLVRVYGSRNGAARVLLGQSPTTVFRERRDDVLAVAPARYCGGDLWRGFSMNLPPQVRDGSTWSFTAAVVDDGVESPIPPVGNGAYTGPAPRAIVGSAYNDGQGYLRGSVKFANASDVPVVWVFATDTWGVVDPTLPMDASRHDTHTFPRPYCISYQQQTLCLVGTDSPYATGAASGGTVLAPSNRVTRLAGGDFAFKLPAALRDGRGHQVLLFAGDATHVDATPQGITPILLAAAPASLQLTTFDSTQRPFDVQQDFVGNDCWPLGLSRLAVLTNLAPASTSVCASIVPNGASNAAFTGVAAVAPNHASPVCGTSPYWGAPGVAAARDSENTLGIFNHPKGATNNPSASNTCGIHAPGFGTSDALNTLNPGRSYPWHCLGLSPSDTRTVAERCADFQGWAPWYGNGEPTLRLRVEGDVDLHSAERLLLSPSQFTALQVGFYAYLTVMPKGPSGAPFWASGANMYFGVNMLDAEESSSPSSLPTAGSRPEFEMWATEQMGEATVSGPLSPIPGDGLRSGLAGMPLLGVSPTRESHGLRSRADRNWSHIRPGGTPPDISMPFSHYGFEVSGEQVYFYMLHHRRQLELQLVHAFCDASTSASTPQSTLEQIASTCTPWQDTPGWTLAQAYSGIFQGPPDISQVVVANVHLNAEVYLGVLDDSFVGVGLKNFKARVVRY